MPISALDVLVLFELHGVLQHVFGRLAGLKVLKKFNAPALVKMPQKPELVRLAALDI